MRDTLKVPLFPSWRLTTILLATVTLVISYLLRTNLHVAKVCMIKNGSTDQRLDRYDWSNQDMGNLFSALYYGQTITQLTGGALSYHIGAHLVLPIGLLGASVVSILFPIAANYAYEAAFGLRVILGMFIALVFTSKYQIVTAWVPKHERGKLVGLLETGVPLGIIFANPLVIELCATERHYAWAWSFYGPGIFGITWALICFIFIRSNPAKHFAISAEEKSYLGNMNSTKSRFDAIPWIKLILNRRLAGFYISFALTRVCHTIFSTSIWTLLNKDKSSLSLREANYPIILYWFAFLISVPIFGSMSDYVVNRGVLSRTKTRKLFVVIGCVLPGAMTIILAFIEDNYWLTFSLLVIAFSAVAANPGGGMYLAPNDMTPDFSSTVWGIAYTGAAVTTTFTNYLVGWTRDNYRDVVWKATMLAYAAFNIAAAFVFCVLASGDQVRSLSSYVDDKTDTKCEEGSQTTSSV
ncbi:hypothetical protein ACOME3_007323 [Neoechinorhynchus agilis]